jgi:hypothetical protein
VQQDQKGSAAPPVDVQACWLYAQLQFLGMPLFEELGGIIERADPIDQFFDFLEGSEHALVNLDPHLTLVLKHSRIMPLLVHAVYRSNDFHTHVSLQASRPKTSFASSLG